MLRVQILFLRKSIHGFTPEIFTLKTQKKLVNTSFSRCASILLHKYGRGRRIRTLGTWFWRPLLYQLSYTPISRFEGVSIQCQQTGLYTPPLLSSFFLQFRKFFLHLLRVGLLTLFDREPDICGGANSCGTGGSSASLYWLGAVREREKAAEILLPIVPPPWRVDRSTTYGAMSSAL